MRKGCELINRRLFSEADRCGTLIAAHRGGAGGHIVENTTDAFTLALRQHADIVELDVVRSTDGELFVFHNGNEKRLLGLEKDMTQLSSKEILSVNYRDLFREDTSVKVNRFDDVLDFLKGKCLINVDRSWNYWDSVLPCIERHGMLDQCIVKSDPEPELLDMLEKYEAPIMFMSKIFKAQDAEEVLRRNINTVAFEVIFMDTSADVLEPDIQKQWHDQGLLLWANALCLKDTWNRSAWHDDNGAILRDPDAHWGWLCEHGFDILQTDWPLMLHEYLLQKGYRKEI